MRSAAPCRPPALLRPGERQEIHDDFIGCGYGDPTPTTLDEILRLARSDGLLLDPVYSGKTAAGLLTHQAAGRWRPGATILLIHSGGTPALFAYHHTLTQHLRERGEVS